MTRGVLLFCFNTSDVQYHRISDRCVRLIQKNLKLPVTVVTDQNTHSAWQDPPAVNFVFKDHERGNKKNSKDWHNLDRCHAYDLSPYDTTLLMDTDYFCYTDNLLQYIESDCEFLVHDTIHDLTNNNFYDFRENSVIPMLWATVILFKKTTMSKHIFDMVKYVKQHYQYFCSLYRIDFRNFRNDYAFSIALHQLSGFNKKYFIPAKLNTLPDRASVLSFNDCGLVFKFKDIVAEIQHQDVHVLNKEIVDV